MRIVSRIALVVILCYAQGSAQKTKGPNSVKDENIFATNQCLAKGVSASFAQISTSI